jgi:hypothetical protein
MLGGAWLAWPWFLLNGFAIGSATRRREAGLVLLALFGSVGLGLGLVALLDARLLHGTALKLALLAVVLCKLAIAYFLYTIQARSFALYEYYSGGVWNGAPLVVVVGAVLRSRVMALLGSGFWVLVLG